MPQASNPVRSKSAPSASRRLGAGAWARTRFGPTVGRPRTRRADSKVRPQLAAGGLNDQMIVRRAAHLPLRAPVRRAEVLTGRSSRAVRLSVNDARGALMAG